MPDVRLIFHKLMFGVLNPKLLDIIPDSCAGVLAEYLAQIFIFALKLPFNVACGTIRRIHIVQ